jgi:single-strand DNA-binding protein
MRETYVNVSGIVASEPRTVELADNRRVTSFRLASSPRWRDQATNSWVDGPTSWYTVSCWRDTASNVAASVHKKDKVVVYGRLRVRDWTSKDGVQRTTTEISAESLGHDLAYGTSVYSRPVRGGAPREGQAEAEELANVVALETLTGHRGEPPLPRAVTELMRAEEEFDEELEELRAQQEEEDAEAAADAAEAAAVARGGQAGQAGQAGQRPFGEGTLVGAGR